MGFKYIIFKEKTLILLVRSVRALLCSGCCRHERGSYLSWWRMNKYNTHNSVQLLFTCKVTQATIACLLWLFKTDCLWPFVWGITRMPAASLHPALVSWDSSLFAHSWIIFVNASHLGCHAVVILGIVHYFMFMVWFHCHFSCHASVTTSFISHLS